MTKSETKMLLTSNFYSILYYNCEIWLMPSLSTILKQHIMSASANALRLLDNIGDLEMSFERLHLFHKRAPPVNVMKFRLAIQLFKIYNGVIINDDWTDMHFQQNFNLRSNTVQIVDRSKFKIGKNIMLNRLLILIRQIEFEPKLFQIENKTIVYGVLNNQM